MDRPSDSQRPTRKGGAAKGGSSLSAKSLYLILYNLVSAILWSVVLGKVTMTASSDGTGKVYANVGEYAKWTQTLAGLEILHSLVGTATLQT